MAGAGVTAMGTIRTVLGDIPSSIIGPMMIHEHILFDIVPPGLQRGADAKISLENRWQIDYRSNECPANAHQQSAAVAVDELRSFALDGGTLVVDQSVAGLARDPMGLAAVSRASGVHVVAAAGVYTAPYLDDEICALDVAGLADRFTDEVASGLDGSDIRAGIIGEIGCSWPIEPVERRALEAAAVAQTRTGATVSVHPGRHDEACAEILDILEAEGADLSRVILCHMDRTHADGDGIQPLLDRGANVEWDFFGIEQSHYWMGEVELPNDLARLRLIRRFADRGHGSQLLMSHDICTKTRMRRWGGHGYGHILRNVRTLMARLGFPERLVTALVRDNPIRLLTLAETPA